MLAPLVRVFTFVVHAVLASALHHLATAILAALRLRHPFVAALFAN